MIFNYNFKLFIKIYMHIILYTNDLTFITAKIIQAR